MKNKPKVLLINPGHERNKSINHLVPHRFHRDIPPISLLTLGSYLQKYNIDVILIDTHIEDNYQEVIKNTLLTENICLVGITALIGNFIVNAQEITGFIKKIDSKIPVVWGGPLTSTLPEACLTEGGADYIVLFCGEEPLRLLVEIIVSGGCVDDVPNIGFLKEGKTFYSKQTTEPIIYDDVLDWSLFGKSINVKQVPYLAYLFSSRGCPYACRFCYHQMSATQKQRKFVFNSSDLVLRELDNIFNSYGINVFTFGDDNFFLNKKRALEILSGMRGRGYYIEQAVGAFADFNDEVITNLKGLCQTVICSVETASERLLKTLNKPIRLETIPAINTKMFQAGINSIHSFMFGLPTETDEDRRASVDLMLKLKQINLYVRGMPYFYTPMPGVPMFDDLEKEYGPFPKSLSFWGDCEILGLEGSYKYRPWLSKDEQMFITQFIDLFKDLFQSINSPLTKEQAAIIEGSSRLRYIFSNIGNLNYPKDRKPKYLLDDILKEKGIVVGL